MIKGNIKDIMLLIAFCSFLLQLLFTVYLGTDEAAEGLLKYIQKYVPQPRTALLAGNSVHADKMFLNKSPYNRVLEHLHYRILDVSAIKEAARRWASPEILKNIPRKNGLHEAKADILESIEEAKYYKNAFFAK